MDSVIPPLLPAIGPLTNLEAILILAVLVLIFMIWRLIGHQECHYTDVPPTSIDESLHALVGSTHGHLTSGNTVSLIQNEAYFDALLDAIGQAKRSVHFETFLWADGVASERVITALIEAAARNVQVRILTDAVGSRGLTSASADRLRKAGCEFHRFHRYRFENFGRFNVRDHRKILIIDGRIAIVGGHCVTDNWLKDGDLLSRIRDISAWISGPAVASIQSCFLENWTEVTGDLFTDDSTFPEIKDTGTTKVHTAYVKADHCPSSVQVLHQLSIGYAKKRIRIQNPYFLPDPHSARALANAAKRGVDVRIMIPALTATDSPSITRAGRFQFQRLLDGGVRIFEYQKTLLHQKVFTIDGVWSGIGSSNFDDRSFEINEEITVGVADPGIATQLESIFDQDAKDCREIDPETWSKRPWRTRAADAFLYLFNEQF